MPLYRHELFTIDLTKVIAVYQNEDESTVTIRTDDQRKIDLGNTTPEAGAELLNEIANQWEKAIGPLLRYGKHVFLTAAIYSIQVEGEDLFIYFRDHSVSFALANAEQALAVLAELTARWQTALGEKG